MKAYAGRGHAGITRREGVVVFSDKVKEFIDTCVKTYAKDHGKDPKILVVSEDTYLDWCMSSFGGSGVLGQKNPIYKGLTIIPGKHLKTGEMELAIEVIKDTKVI